MSNRLKNESSPYLLQHSENPVDWFAWGDEAFDKARAEDKPIFLSIGYSTCHWCHVMAHESFENEETARILNRCFVSIKVDREERPDVDSVYMAVCQAFTGGGGWPMSIFMTPDRKPFFAGTYFPPTSRYGSPGFAELLLAIHDAWLNERDALVQSADGIIKKLQTDDPRKSTGEDGHIQKALDAFKRSFDGECGGFGRAPKFPSPHNLIFLLSEYEKHGDKDALNMAEVTLDRMYSGGLFDHIGFGFCRYSTDRYFLVPHFEKMLYDNALLIIAYCKAFELTRDGFYLEVARKTAQFLLDEMADRDGGFFSAADADSAEGEGRYYLFTPREIESVIGKDEAAAFCECFDITDRGNFEGGSIPNLLKSNADPKRFDRFLPALREYRKSRMQLGIDDKILTFWNSLAIAAFCALYRVSENEIYLTAALRAQSFIERELSKDDMLFVSGRGGKTGANGFLDDYAGYALALLSLYDATLKTEYLTKARAVAEKAVHDFFDEQRGGFYQTGEDNEALPLRLKECYDGALPSGNSLMAYLLVRLSALDEGGEFEETLNKQLEFLKTESAHYPAGYSMFLLALSDSEEAPCKVVALGDESETERLPFTVPLGASMTVLRHETSEYKRLDGKRAFYVCGKKGCLPPVSELTRGMLV